MSKKPAALPDIEEATFAACLDPLAAALVAGAAEDAADRVADPDWPPPDPPRMARPLDPPRMPRPLDPPHLPPNRPRMPHDPRRMPHNAPHTPHDPPRMQYDAPHMPQAQAGLAYPLTSHCSRGVAAPGDGGSRPLAAPTPQALAEWRSLADQEFAEFCTIELFLAKTDAELSAAVAAYPRQLLGFLERITRLEDRRALQQQAMTELLARMQMALIQAATDSSLDLPHPAAALGHPTLV